MPSDFLNIGYNCFFFSTLKPSHLLVIHLVYQNILRAKRLMLMSAVKRKRNDKWWRNKNGKSLRRYHTRENMSHLSKLIIYQ